MGSILLWEPFDLVDFLLYLQALEIVELRLVALESAVDVILALAVRRIFTLQGNPDRGPELQDGGTGGNGHRVRREWLKLRRARQPPRPGVQQCQWIQPIKGQRKLLFRWSLMCCEARPSPALVEVGTTATRLAHVY